MAVNTSKTKFLVFRTRGKMIDPADCQLMFNSNEIGQIENPDLIVPITRVHLDGEEKKVLNYWACTLMGTYLLMHI